MKNRGLCNNPNERQIYRIFRWIVDDDFVELCYTDLLCFNEDSELCNLILLLLLQNQCYVFGSQKIKGIMVSLNFVRNLVVS